MLQILNLSAQFVKNNILSAKFFAFLQRIIELESDQDHEENVMKAKSLAGKILGKNKMGPLVFVTPEYGKYCKVGGIAVMVQDLCETLARFGEEVIVVMPYYHSNSKGETNYMDQWGVEYKKNIDIYLKDHHEFGVHYVEDRGVKIYFLHNPHIYPLVYANLGPLHIVSQLACTGKSTLELLCQEGIKPSVVVTNDWPAGLVAAYHKDGKFGDYFNDSKFFHILHNADSSHEGRIYIDNKDDCCHLHHLPADFLIDPY